VKDYLVLNGIASERIRTVGFGPNNPLDTNRTTRGRAMNRRSEIRVIDERQPAAKEE
jgi:outer membrane protein OmpA-like peptidoglycan-associated protein